MKIFFSYACLTLTVCAVGGPAAAADRPNVIVILADDLGYADVGFHGCKDIPTPHLDALAESGVRCTNGYVSHPFCSPTRAGLLTGRYQHRFGHENNPTFLPNDDKVGLPLDQVTIADVMKSARYATGAVGKWHVGAAPCFHPTRRGFDEYFGLIGGGHDYFQHNMFKTNPARARSEYFIPLQRGTTAVEESEYLTDALSREAVAFIDRHKDRPFFLYLAYNAPHTPLQALPKYLDRVKHIQDEKRRTYAAMTCGVDDGVGRLLEQLRKLNIEDNTLVIFLSDNGGPIAVTNSRNDPLRGAKGQVYEGGIRVPFVVRWPAKLRPGTYDEPVTSLDILPTAAAAAGAKLPEQHKLDGTDLTPMLSGEAKGSPHDVLFWRSGGGAAYAVRQGPHKLVKASAMGKVELYDLAKDVAEKNDLAAKEPDRVAQLQGLYDTWNKQLLPPRWQNPRAAKKPAAKK